MNEPETNNIEEKQPEIDQKILLEYEDHLLEIQEDFYKQIDARRLLAEILTCISFNMASSCLAYLMIQLSIEYFLIRGICYLIGTAVPITSDLTDFNLKFQGNLEIDNIQLLGKVLPKLVIGVLVVEYPIREHAQLIRESQESISQIEQEISSYYSEDTPRDIPVMLIGSIVIAIVLVLININIRKN